MPLLCVIPARLASSRLPNKPLVPLAGEPLILWVVRRLHQFAVADRVVVATDAREIATVVERAGLEAVMTSPKHHSGTERIAEVTANKEFKSYDAILNVQGDEPFVSQAAVQGTIGRLNGGDPIATAAGVLDPALASDPSRVKVVIGVTGHAVYFSRAPIPFDRDGSRAATYRQHVGIYGYTRDALERWVRLPPVPEERREQLEQLRPLLHGMPIGVAVFDEHPAPGIDTPEDLRWAERHISRQLKEVSP